MSVDPNNQFGSDWSDKIKKKIKERNPLGYALLRIFWSMLFLPRIYSSLRRKQRNKSTAVNRHGGRESVLWVSWRGKGGTSVGVNVFQYGSSTLAWLLWIHPHHNSARCTLDPFMTKCFPWWCLHPHRTLLPAMRARGCHSRGGSLCFRPEMLMGA